MQLVGNNAVVRHLWVSESELDGKVTNTKIGVGANLSASQVPKVRRLFGGGEWIRTSGTAAQKPWISAAFRAWRRINGALKRYRLIVQPFFCASNHSIEPGWGTD